MTMIPLPHEFVEEVVRQQDMMGCPEMVPAWAELLFPDGVMRWKAYSELTVGDCEQLVEQHTRASRKAIECWLKNHTTRQLRKAGKSILYARLYRCRYLTLIGKEDITEADFPFPFTEVEDDS